MPPRRGPSAASWAPSAAAPCCRGTGTAGLGAPGTGGHSSALGLALACTPGTAHADAADACAGVKAEDGDGMEVTLEEVTAPNGLGVLLKATLAVAVTLGATAEAMGTGLTTSVGSAYVGWKTKQKHTKPHQTHAHSSAGILAVLGGDDPPSVKHRKQALPRLQPWNIWQNNQSRAF